MKTQLPSLPTLFVYVALLTLLLPMHRSHVTAQGVVVSETIYLDTFDLDGDGVIGPVSTVITLSSGDYYLVTISGTWSAWSSNFWSSVCKGTPENSPQTPSPGTTNGKVGLDPEFVFAAPVGTSFCSRLDNPPYLPGTPLEVSVNDGSTWIDPIPTNPTYNPLHVYTYFLRGNSFPALFRKTDVPSNDNYGVLTIQIEGPLPKVYLPIVQR